MKVEVFKCDVCKNELKNYTSGLKKNVPVIFLTDDTEGKSCEPYLVFEKLDICDECYTKMLKYSSILNATGAQGHNDYFFPKNKI